MSLDNERYFAFDLPYKYKDLEFHPVKMKDYIEFHFFVQSLLLEKNSIPSVEIIQMTYLEFMYKQTTRSTPYAVMFRELLAMCLRIPSTDITFRLDRDNGKPYFIVSEKKYDSTDFDEIKKIICEQNDVHIPDETIQKEIRDKMEEAKRLRAKQEGTKMGSLEDLVVAVLISTSLNIEEISNLSIRKFTRILQRLDHKLHYQIYLTATMSGNVKLKDKSFLKHWLADLSKDAFEGTLIGLDEVKGQLSFSDQK